MFQVYFLNTGIIKQEGVVTQQEDSKQIIHQNPYFLASFRSNDCFDSSLLHFIFIFVLKTSRKIIIFQILDP